MTLPRKNPVSRSVVFGLPLGHLQQQQQQLLLLLLLLLLLQTEEQQHRVFACVAAGAGGCWSRRRCRRCRHCVTVAASITRTRQAGFLALRFWSELPPRAAGAATETAFPACDVRVLVFETRTMQARVNFELQLQGIKRN